MGDSKEPTMLLKKSRGISPALVACPILDARVNNSNFKFQQMKSRFVEMVLYTPLLLLLLLLLLL